MARSHVYGVVSAEEWQAIGDEDARRRGGHVEADLTSSILTTVSAFVILLMLVIGPMWTIIEVVGAADEHSSVFDTFWVVSLVLALVAAVPLGLAIRREPTRGRFALLGLIVVSVAIMLATCPWF